jgi:hypothetical protein
VLRIFAGFPGFEDGFCAPLVPALYVFQLFVRQVLQPHKRIVRFADADEFVQLHLNRGGVTVLRILDQEHHQKRDDGRAGVDHKLPSIREPEERTRNCPDHHGPECKGKDPGSTYLAGADLTSANSLPNFPGFLVGAVLIGVSEPLFLPGVRGTTS